MTIFKTFSRRADKALLRFEQMTIVVGCVLIWTIFGLITVQMLGRVLFHTGLAWIGELARYLQIVLVFIGMGYAHRYSAHVGVDIFVHLLPRAPRRIIHVIVQAMIVVTSIIVVLGCWMLMERMGSQISAALGLPVTAFVAPTAVGFTLLAIEAFIRMFAPVTETLTVEGVEVQSL